MKYSSQELANDILGYLQNIEDTDDARVFARIYLDAIENASLDEVNRLEVTKIIGEVDNRFLERMLREAK